MSLVNFLAVIMVAAAALFLFFYRSAVSSVAGFLLVIAVIVMVERLVPTVYVFTSDGQLVIDRGRFSRPVMVPVDHIIKVRKVCPPLLPVRFLVVEYGAGHIITVQPADHEAFIVEVRRRQTQVEKLKNNNTNE